MEYNGFQVARGGRRSGRTLVTVLRAIVILLLLAAALYLLWQGRYFALVVWLLTVVFLLDNSVKYSPEGSEVLVEAVKAVPEVTIRVTDRGSGIPAEHLGRIFERFYRVDKSRSRRMGGTGLGLAIVKHVVQVHGGRVEVESTPGKGSTFTVHLPAAPKENGPSPPA